jgi:2-polyprenyl-3-methyl-5-hydroxy-6-metoxy-1,4-benzoquinol methylase
MNYVVDSYENYKEENRLTTNNSRRIEFLTTARIFEEYFPPKAKMLDCAAGTGIYAFYFAEKGYNVTALDITPRHIEIISNELKSKPYTIQAAVNDATDLSKFDDETFDIVLCMGPIYHLTNKSLRQKCLDECKRVLKTGGLVVVAYINRFYIMPNTAMRAKEYLKLDFVKTIVETGTITHDDKNCFWTDSYYAIPEEMEQTLKDMSFTVIDHLSPDGLSPLLSISIDSMSESEFKTWCEYHYMVCREKRILGAGTHGLIIGRK